MEILLMLESGVEIWEWQGAMVHAKTAVIDEELTLVGSSNLDPLSLQRNYEINLLLVDSDTARGMKEMFEEDLENAQRIDLDTWRQRPLWQRRVESAATLFSRGL
jgi:cardiolipin synthase